MATLILNEREVDVYIAGIDPKDYPDFCDAYFDDMQWTDTGEMLTDEEADQLYRLYQDDICELAHNQIF